MYYYIRGKTPKVKKMKTNDIHGENVDKEVYEWEIENRDDIEISFSYTVENDEGEDFNLFADPENRNKFFEKYERVFLTSTGNLEILKNGAWETLYYGLDLSEEEIKEMDKNFNRWD